MGIMGVRALGFGGLVEDASEMAATIINISHISPYKNTATTKPKTQKKP